MVRKSGTLVKTFWETSGCRGSRADQPQWIYLHIEPHLICCFQLWVKLTENLLQLLPDNIRKHVQSSSGTQGRVSNLQGKAARPYPLTRTHPWFVAQEQLWSKACWAITHEQEKAESTKATSSSSPPLPNESSCYYKWDSSNATGVDLRMIYCVCNKG